ncbi:hypothetical protein [Streptomyces sp. NPDC054794]
MVRQLQAEGWEIDPLDLAEIAGTLDRTFPGIFATDYAERLEAARRRLTSGSLGEE